MSKFTDRLAAIGIHTPHDLVATGHPHVLRSSCMRGWLVIVKGDAGKRAFFADCDRPECRTTVDIAIRYCGDFFPDLEMVPGPWRNTYVPKVDLDAAKEKVEVQP